MSISEKIKTIDNKIEQIKAQYKLDRQIGKISALSSGNVSKYEFLKTYSPLGKELKPQTDIAKKQYKKLDDTLKLDKRIKKEKPALEKYSKSNLIYNSKHSFYKYYRDSKNSNNFSLKSKYSFLAKPFNDLNEFK